MAKANAASLSKQRIVAKAALACLFAFLIVVCAACGGDNGTGVATEAPDTQGEPFRIIGNLNLSGTGAEAETGTPATERKLSAAEALELVVERFDFEDYQGDVDQHDSEWAGDVELYRFELHWYGDALTYFSIRINARSGEMDIEEIEYDYAQDMLAYWERAMRELERDAALGYWREALFAYWRGRDWKYAYLDVMLEAQHFAEAGVPGDGYDGRYPLQLTGYLLADLNFDGIPELLIFGDGASASDGVRIFTIKDTGVEMIFQGWANLSGLKLYRNLSDGSFAWGFISANGDYEWYGGEVHRTDANTLLDKDFASRTRTNTFSQENSYDSGRIHTGSSYVIDGHSVSVSDFHMLIDELFPLDEFELVDVNKVVLEYEYYDRWEGFTQRLSGELLWQYLESYVFLPHAYDIENERFGFKLTIPSGWKAYDPYDDGFFIESVEGIDIRVYGEHAIFPIKDYLEADNVVFVNEFLFGDGVGGWEILMLDDDYNEGIVKYLRGSENSFIYTTFYVNYVMARPWFVENEDLLRAIASTLREAL